MIFGSSLRVHTPLSKPPLSVSVEGSRKCEKQRSVSTDAIRLSSLYQQTIKLSMLKHIGTHMLRYTCRSRKS